MSPATIHKAPDFVLSYDNLPNTRPTNGKILFYLREDDESAIDANQRAALLASVNQPYDVFDTTIREKIGEDARQSKLDETLEMFASYDYIIAVPRRW